MKRTILLSLAMMLVLASTSSFAPAPTVDAAKPQAFSADIVVWPAGAPNNVQHGNSDRWRTVYERYGGVASGDINGSIDMSITTNFVQTDAEGPFSGPFHSTLVITTYDGGTITLNVTGKIDGVKAYFGPRYGVQIAYASITGKFNSTSATGSQEGKHVNGTLDYLIDLTNGPPPPYGGGISEGTLTGTIH